VFAYGWSLNKYNSDMMTELCFHFGPGFQIESINLYFYFCNKIVMKVCELVLVLCVHGALYFLVTGGTDSTGR
jgi:hypothetical protein